MTSARITVSAGKLSISDLLAVADSNAHVVIDSSIQAASASDNSAELEVEAPTATTPHCTVISRAIVLLQLHRALRLPITSSTSAFANFLADVLNQDAVPALSADSKDAYAECKALVALSFGSYEKTSVTLPSTRLSRNEQIALTHEVALGRLATASVAVGGAKGLLPIADAVSGLTLEALRANSTAIDAEFIDASRPHRGIQASAANLRLMVESSKFCTPQATTDTFDITATVPQLHGPAREAIITAFSMVETEMNSGIPMKTLLSRPDAACMSTQPIDMALSTTLEALQVLFKASNERLQALNTEGVATNGSSSAHELVSIVCSSFEKEIATANVSFQEEEAAMKAKLAEKEKRAEEAAAKAAAAAKKEDEKLASMSEAQREKVMEKRRKKMEKQNAKPSSKASLGLGAGSTAFRSHMQSQSSCLNAFNLRSDGLPAFLDDMFVKLGSGGQRRKPKIAKGAQDFLPHQMALREKIFNKIRSVFKRHAGVEIETPVFELKETLTGKYGEDSKLIYDLADQGGELLALRYDLTVPFARFMAMHNPGNIKRYHLARVYRRDNPQMARGRFREFYQCDFDIAGNYASMLPDAEAISVGVEVLQQFPEVGPFTLKLSHRLLLDAILAICGVPQDKLRTTCSAIDKLDKEPWSEVRREMVEDKNLPPEVADRIEPFVCKVGSPKELHAQMLKENIFGDNEDAKEAMDQLGRLFDYLEAMGVLEFISFDLSLARGLDYYTGLIYEFVLLSPEYNLGSIGAGGRYDNLVGMFSATGAQIPCVGISMGIERIFGILQSHAEKEKRAPPAQVLVASTGGSLMTARLELCRLLWSNNIAAEIVQQEKPSLGKQRTYALDAGIPFMVTVGEDEVKSGEVKVRELEAKEEVSVKREDMVSELLKRGCSTTVQLSM